MKKNIVLLIMCLMVISVFAGCSNKGQTGPKTTPTPEVTFTPTPTPYPDKYVDLTEEQVLEYMKFMLEYQGMENHLTRRIVAYYKYLGMEDFLLPVVIDYTLSEAEEEFGGEWEVLDGEKVEIDGIFKRDVWLRGKLTVAQMEYALLNDGGDRVFLVNDPDVESRYSGKAFQYGGYSMMPHSHYISWLRYWGDAYVYE